MTRSERRSAKLRTCRLRRYSRRRSPGGRYNESNYPVQELGQKRGGGRIFEGGVMGVASNEAEEAVASSLF